jgi:hypothetical protein
MLQDLSGQHEIIISRFGRKAAVGGIFKIQIVSTNQISAMISALPEQRAVWRTTAAIVKHSRCMGRQ